MTKTENLESMCMALGVDTTALPDRLLTTYYKAIIEKCGVDAETLPDNLQSTYLNAIAECIGNAGGGGGGGDEKTTPPWIDTRQIDSIRFFIYSGRNQKLAGKLDTRNVTDFTSAFNECGLDSLGTVDMRSAKLVTNVFYKCTSVKSVNIKNIPISLSVSALGIEDVDDIVSILSETRYYTDGEDRKLTIGSTKLALLPYVKQTGAILDVDDNEIPELVEGCKIPVVACTETDEGAISYSDYMTNKGWTLA